MADTYKYCKYCKKEGQLKKYKSYWNADFLAHQDCYKAHDHASDIYEMQKIDADCNDCKYFKRGKLISKGIWGGVCERFTKSVRAYPQFATGHSCFVHRKD